MRNQTLKVIKRTVASGLSGMGSHWMVVDTNMLMSGVSSEWRGLTVSDGGARSSLSHCSGSSTEVGFQAQRFKPGGRQSF